jgi:tetratricopeptide (TPR) repeat protein
LTLSGAKSLGARELAGLRWSTFASEPIPGFHIVEWLVIDAGVELGITMRVADATRGVPPPELTSVVAGLRREPIEVSREAAEIERGVIALWETASADGWNGNGWTASNAAAARAGIAALRRVHPDRYEGPLFDAAIALLQARQEIRVRSGFFEPVGPFEAAFEERDGHVTTTAFAASYDAASVARSLREALRLAPGSFWARYHLGIALVRAGDAPAGIRELSALADANPDAALALFALSLAQRDAGDRRAALESARRAASANRQREVFSALSGLPGNTLIDDFFFGATLIDELVRELRR